MKHLFSLSEGQEHRHEFKSILHRAADNLSDTGLHKSTAQHPGSSEGTDPQPRARLDHFQGIQKKEALSGLCVVSSPLQNILEYSLPPWHSPSIGTGVRGNVITLNRINM
jgi:hypothetical protein